MAEAPRPTSSHPPANDTKRFGPPQPYLPHARSRPNALPLPASHPYSAPLFASHPFSSPPNDPRTQPHLPRPPSPGVPFVAQSHRRSRTLSTLTASSEATLPADAAPKQAKPTTTVPSNSVPAVLTRDKKPKACRNCQKAKLRCTVAEGEVDCVRCLSRKEKCLFILRSTEDDWQQTITTDLYQCTEQVAYLTSIVHQLVTHHSVHHGTCTHPLDHDLPFYHGPKRELNVLNGLAGQKGDGPRKRRRSHEEEDDDMDDPLVSAGSDPRRPSTSTSSLQQSLDDLPQLPTPPFAYEPVLHATPRAPQRLTLEDLSLASNYAPTGVDGAVESVALGNGSFEGAMPWGQPWRIEDDVNDADRLGSQDTRGNIITKGILTNAEACVLAEYFFDRLAPHMFGPAFSFTSFPFLSPQSVTPMILSVICHTAAQRVPDFHQRTLELGQDVADRLDAPADSFWPADLPSTTGFDSDLNPELGIGPEEIFAAYVLSIYSDDRTIARDVAAQAFKWARGWNKFRKAKGVSVNFTALARATNVLCELREASQTDMMRLWLLGYVVEGTTRIIDDPRGPLHSVDIHGVHYDPDPYCAYLLRDDSADAQPDSHDVLLAFHARLIGHILEWLRQRAEAARALEQFEASRLKVQPAQSSIRSYAPPAPSPTIQPRSASSFNKLLAHWDQEFAEYGLAPAETRFLMLYRDFVCMLANATAARDGLAPRRASLDPHDGTINGGAELDGLFAEDDRAVSWPQAVAAARSILGRVASWDERELREIPPCYQYMITTAGSVVVDALAQVPISERGPDSGLLATLARKMTPAGPSVLKQIVAAADTMSAFAMRVSHGR
ncbi:hypothetical protein Q5752_006126 [Cryptotrichosporon argae]